MASAAKRKRLINRDFPVTICRCVRSGFPDPEYTTTVGTPDHDAVIKALQHLLDSGTPDSSISSAGHGPGTSGILLAKFKFGEHDSAFYLVGPSKSIGLITGKHLRVDEEELLTCIRMLNGLISARTAHEDERAATREVDKTR